MSERAWVASGNLDNWEQGLENGIWGIVPKLQHHWKKVERNDLVLFYCIKPVKGFFGAGIIRAKFKQTAPYWKEEIAENRVIWPYRFEFDVTHLIPLGNWGTQAISNKDFNLSVLAGINPVKDWGKALKVLDALKFTVIHPLEPEKKVAAKIFEIGKIQRMVVESEYPVETHLLDVVWKRTIRSVPTYAFLVNLQRDFEQSINILKHAYDLWNSRAFLITEARRLPEASSITSGLFHEFSSAMKILTTSQIQELYDSKKTYYDLEERYGLR
ncbi:MAG: hypothetical protein JRJ66_05075 [Deltaproteobacteria bacterium]|nr:hypothetical protein [Deltaproteobacteria bacterium]MBW2045911.1 hypothetical protein [Deltaproteobacteria bacterium]MBW2299519.1 hypothetical protein [Deltaproteobacteria bacterium]